MHSFSLHPIQKAIIIVLLSLSSLLAISENDFVNAIKCDQIIDKSFLKICYSYDLKSAKSVSYTLNGDLVNELNIKDRPNFTVETTLDSTQRASTSDYTNSGYDRGHLAPDAAFDWSTESLKATYSLANIIPQVQNVNRYTWVKAEEHARLMAVTLGAVNVINVIEYTNTPLRIGDHGIAVSSGYYKVLYSDDQSYKRCFYYANDLNVDTSNDTLDNHDVSCTVLYPNTKKDYGFLVPIITMIL